MDSFSTEQLDRQLGDWLRDEHWMGAPSGLVEDVFAQTSRTRQLRRWPIALRTSGVRSIDGSRARAWQLASGFAGAAAIVLIVVTFAFVVRSGRTGPATTPGPSPTPSPSPTVPGSTAPPTPVPTTLGTVGATSLDLGISSGPIGVTEAFGSIWTANLDEGTVRRFDPATMADLGRVPAQGVGMLAEADGALWATHQGGIGLARIDPATNTVVAEVGEDPPCGAPVAAFGSLWQSACDAGAILRIDPARNVVTDRIPAAGYGPLVLAGGRLIASGPAGLASLDPASRAFTPIGYTDALEPRFLASDGDTVWVMGSTELVRVDPTTGQVLATLEYPGARSISFADATGWLTAAGDGVVEIDLATNQVRQVIPVPGAPNVSHPTAGALWITDFSGGRLWRIDR